MLMVLACPASALLSVHGLTVNREGPRDHAVPTAAKATSPALFGLTIDNIANIGQVVTELRFLPVHPTTRVTFALDRAPQYYASALAALHTVSTTMGELLDSSQAAAISVSAFQARVTQYLRLLAPTVNIWEVGNEVNGSWAGSYASAGARITEGVHDVASMKGRSALTLYANEYGSNHCEDGPSELTPIAFSRRYVPKEVRNRLSYVFESFYPTQCESVYPSNAQVRSEMLQLHDLFPNAKVGFGEVGLPTPVTSKNIATAKLVMTWAYRLNPDLAYYVGGYFWWYGDEDLVPTSKSLFPYFLAALRSEATLLR
jgi:hypothetical protein